MLKLVVQSESIHSSQLRRPNDQARDEGRARGRPPICGRRVGADPFHAAVVSKALDTRVRGAGRTTSSDKGRARGRPPVCGRRISQLPICDAHLAINMRPSAQCPVPLKIRGHATTGKYDAWQGYATVETDLIAGTAPTQHKTTPFLDR